MMEFKVIFLDLFNWTCDDFERQLISHWVYLQLISLVTPLPTWLFYFICHRYEWAMSTACLSFGFFQGKLLCEMREKMSMIKVFISILWPYYTPFKVALVSSLFQWYCSCPSEPMGENSFAFSSLSDCIILCGSLASTYTSVIVCSLSISWIILIWVCHLVSYLHLVQF